MKLSATLLFVLLLGRSLQQEDPAAEKKKPETPFCIKFYRPDLLETWIVPPTSPLCKVDKPSYSGFYYGLVAGGQDLFITARGIKESFNAMQVSEKTFSVVVYKKNLKMAHFVTIEKTDNNDLKYNFEYVIDDTMANGQYRTTYYVGEEDFLVEGADIKNAITFAFCILQVIQLSSISGPGNMLFGLAFNFFLMVPASIILVMFQFDNIKKLAMTLGGVLLVALIAGYIAKHTKNLVYSVACGILMLAYYWLAGTDEIRAFFIPILLPAFAIPGFYSIVNCEGTKAAKITFIMQFGLFWAQVFLFWSYLFVVTIPGMWVRITGCPSDYKAPVVGKGFFITWHSWIIWAAVLGFEFVTAMNRFAGDRKTLTMDSGNML